MTSVVCPSILATSPAIKENSAPLIRYRMYDFPFRSPQASAVAAPANPELDVQTTTYSTSYIFPISVSPAIHLVFSKSPCPYPPYLIFIGDFLNSVLSPSLPFLDLQGDNRWCQSSMSKTTFLDTIAKSFFYQRMGGRNTRKQCQEIINIIQ